MPITTPPNQDKFIAPVLAPDLQRRQMEIQRNKMMAQQLMQSEAPQGQMVSGHYVAPSWTQHLAHALRQGIGGKMERDLPKQQAELQQAQKDHILGQFGLKPTPQQLAAGLDADSAQAFPVDDSGQAPAGQPLIPGIPGMSREQQAYLAMHIGMEDYLKLAASKGGPVNIAPGGSLYNPQTGTVDYTAPKDGIAIEGGRAVPIPGYSEAAAAAAGDLTRAQEGAKAGFDLVEVPDGKGGTRMMPRDQAVSTLSGDTPAASPTGSGAVPTGGLGSTPAKETLEARGRLENLTQQGDALLSTINALENYEGLEGLVGATTYLPALRGSKRYDFEKQLEQAQSQVFLEGYERLKGGGVITDFEGSKAEKAIARLDSGQSPAAFRSALKDLRDVVLAGIKRAHEKAGVDMPGRYAEMMSGAVEGQQPPPESAVNFLRKNPGLRQQFDAKYGHGAAAAILGG